MRTPKCHTGEQYGYWTVLDECCRYGTRTYWKCRCVCGEEKFVRIDDLNAGKTKSCGCKKGEVWREGLGIKN